MIVRHIMGEQNKSLLVSEERAKKSPKRSVPKAESMWYDKASYLLGEDGMSVIRNTMANFRK